MVTVCVCPILQTALPPFFYSLDEIARAGKLRGVPPRQRLMASLDQAGYVVATCHLEVTGSTPCVLHSTPSVPESTLCA
jgi:hypothetical protein